MFLISCLFFLLVSACGGGENKDTTSETDTETPAVDVQETPEAVQEESDGPFEVESGIIVYESKNLAGEVTAINTLTFTEYGNRLKLEESIDGETSIYVYDQNTSTGATKFAGRDRVNKISVRQGEINTFVAQRSESGFEQRDNEDLLGKSCEVFANRAQSEAGEPQVMYWLHRGIVLKEINRLGSGYQFEAVSMEERSVAEDAFSLLY